MQSLRISASASALAGFGVTTDLSCGLSAPLALLPASALARFGVVAGDTRGFPHIAGFNEGPFSRLRRSRGIGVTVDPHS